MNRERGEFNFLFLFVVPVAFYLGYTIVLFFHTPVEVQAIVSLLKSWSTSVLNQSNLLSWYESVIYTCLSLQYRLLVCTLLLLVKNAKMVGL
jgi:hypothetical protein